jgi:hypothetical protein
LTNFGEAKVVENFRTYEEYLAERKGGLIESLHTVRGVP